MPSPPLLTTLSDFLTPEGLESTLGPVRGVAAEDSETLGYSDAGFVRMVVELRDGRRERLFLKSMTPSVDWFSRRTGDEVGREALVVTDSRLEKIWEEVVCPYRAVARADGVVRLLMDDVSAGLLPDERAPLADDVEGALLGTVARLHARFWGDASLEAIPFLHRPEDLLYIMGPLDHARDDAEGWPDVGVRSAVKKGWAAAMELLPAPLAQAVTTSPAEVAAAWQDLPATLVHGDTKVANFAVLPDMRVSLFDWAFTGWGPATLDLGWYLAVNGARLVGSKEDTMRRYRGLLESARGEALPDRTWGRLEEAGIVCGALMLLWSKALGVRAGREGADAEWDWWISRLEPWAAGLG
jgi:hypothetical protein